MVKIKTLNINANFKYLWLKYIKGYDLNVHCAKSLLGTYSKKINTEIKIYQDLILDEENTEIFYLCGVSTPYNWYKNFHLAFKHKEGSFLQYEANGIEITIENAVIIPITTDYIDFSHPKAKFKSYNTCRNWQFANWLSKQSI